MIFLNTNFGKLVSGFSHLFFSFQLANDFYNPPSLLLSLFLLTGKKIFYIVCFSFSSFYYLFIIYSFHFHSFIIIAIIIVQIYLFYFILILFVYCISISLSCVLSIFAIFCSFVCAFVQLMFALQVVTPVVFLISSLFPFTVHSWLHLLMKAIMISSWSSSTNTSCVSFRFYIDL